MNENQPAPSVRIVQDSWGDTAPAWVIALAKECDASSQAKAAQKIGRSPTAVNKVLKNTYNGDLENLATRVEAILIQGKPAPLDKKPNASQLVSSIGIVQESWGDAAPAWVIALAKECDASSQAKAAQKIGRSPSAVNQVLKNKYKADLDSIRSRVEAALVSEVVVCPVLGDITGSQCLINQERPFQPYNHVMVSLFRACRKCPRKINRECQKK